MNKFIERVVNHLYYVTTGPQKMRLFLTPVFGLVFFFVVLLLVFISFSLDRFWGLPEFAPKLLRAILSLPLLIGGSFLWLWSVLKFLKTKGTPVPVNPPTKLITDGPYLYSRNPMMTGLFMVMAGIGIFTGSVTLTFFMTPLFVVISIIEFKYIEEPELEKRFGNIYSYYKEKTPLIIPKIRGIRK